jgi:Ala-tRNA(Pro) deacylase
MSTPYEKIISFLKQHNVVFEEIEHEPVYTSEQAAKVRGMSLSSGAKSLLLKAENDFVLVILPGDKRLDSKLLKSYLSVKNIRFATPEEVEHIMGCQIGACYPFGNLIGIRTFVDKSLTDCKEIFFNPGVHDKSIKMKLIDYQAVVQPEIASFSQVFGAK